MLAMDAPSEPQRLNKAGDFRTFHGPATVINGHLNGSLNGSSVKGVSTSPKATKMNGESKSPAAATAVEATGPDRDEDDAQHMHRHMWIVTGTAGSGKTTVAEYLAHELQVPYIEGDDVSGFAPHHPYPRPLPRCSPDLASIPCPRLPFPALTYPSAHSTTLPRTAPR